MTTNQTIDGVPGLRELLERLYAEHVSIAGPGFWLAWKELRALLDKEVSGDSRAPQSQGEPVAWTEVDVLDFMSVALRHAEYSGLSPSDILDGLRFMAEKGKPAFVRAEQPAPVAVAAPDRIKGMIETVGGEYAVMIDPDNRHFGWTFKRHPDGQWVSGRKATDAEMSAARSHAHITNQL